MSENGSIGQILKTVTRSKRLRSLISILLFLGIVLGLGIVPVESRAGVLANIKDVEDGIWWAITTITGVGLGDVYPVTTLGRVFGVILEVFGVVFFGSIVALVAISLLRYQEDYYVRRITARIDGLEIKIDELKKHIDFMVKDKEN